MAARSRVLGAGRSGFAVSRRVRFDTVDDINPALPLRTLSYGNSGIVFIMGNAGCISATVLKELVI